MKILVIGGNGTIGKAVTENLKVENELIIAGRKNTDIIVDISNSNSIIEMFQRVGKVDSIVCIAGEAKWDYFENMSEEDYYIGIKSKLMGQVNLTRIGYKFLNDNGSITLSTGILADEPVLMTTSAAMVNGAIHSFIKATSLELNRGLRINAISLGMVEDAYEKYKNFFPGHNPVPMNKVKNAYIKSIYGKITGEVVKVYEH